MDAELVKLAIEEAQKSSEPLKCGAVIVKDGKVLAKSFNSQRSTHDATAHAEINAIRKAGSILGNKNLDGCTIYCSIEPCAMCLSAIVFAKIKKIVYAQSLKEVSHVPVGIDIETFLTKAPHIDVIKISK